MNWRSLGVGKPVPVFLMVLVCCFIACAGCRRSSSLSITTPVAPGDPGDPSTAYRKALILVYMNGDNDLEYQALNDLNEMEAAASLAGLEVLVLMDRSPGYDSSMGNWSGTRIYRLRTDRGGMNFEIVSERLACPPLNLASHGDYEELNLGISGVLSAFIGWGKENYPADGTILVVWGHGTGWRNRNLSPAGGRLPIRATESIDSDWRAFSFDDSDCDFLYTAELGDALEEESVDMVLFDTCSAAMIENGWELKDGCEYLVGSEDLIPSGGLDYRDWFERLAAWDGSMADAGKAAVESFGAIYPEQSRAVFSVIETAGLNEVYDAFVELLGDLEMDALISADPAEYYHSLKVILTERTEDFYVAPGDLNVDLGDMGLLLKGDGNRLTEAVRKAVLYNFSSAIGNPRAGGLAIHLAPLNSSGEILMHDEAYYKNSDSSYAPEWVRNSPWCPDPDAKSGFLYHLFYE